MPSRLPSETSGRYPLRMGKVATLNTLAALEQEMARAGRSEEEQALRDLLATVAREDPELLTVEQVAERLELPADDIEAWIERGGLEAVNIEGRWLVAAENVEQHDRLRRAIWELDREGYPTEDELRDLYSRPRDLSQSQA